LAGQYYDMLYTTIDWGSGIVYYNESGYQQQGQGEGKVYSSHDMIRR
jgi:hypothetical protein